jgi:hypothetical protein
MLAPLASVAASTAWLPIAPPATIERVSECGLIGRHFDIEETPRRPCLGARGAEVSDTSPAARGEAHRRARRA